MDWLPITLLCAFSLASSDAATKAWLRDYSARELALVRFALAGVLLAPALLLFPLGRPAPEFWLWVAALVPLEILAMLLYMKAIRDHPLSLTLPYLAFTPVFIVVTGWLILGETVDADGLAGVLLVVAGGWLLNVGHAQPDDWRTWIMPLKAIFYEPGSRMMLGVAVIFSLTAVMGKGAMRHTQPEAFGAFYFVLIGAVTALLFSLREPRILRRILRLWPSMSRLLTGPPASATPRPDPPIEKKPPGTVHTLCATYWRWPTSFGFSVCASFARRGAGRNQRCYISESTFTSTRSRLLS